MSADTDTSARYAPYPPGYTAEEHRAIAAGVACDCYEAGHYRLKGLPLPQWEIIAAGLAQWSAEDDPLYAWRWQQWAAGDAGVWHWRCGPAGHTLVAGPAPADSPYRTTRDTTRNA